MGSCTAEYLVDLLSHNYLNTLIIDACKNPNGSIPGSRHYLYLSNWKEQFAGNGVTNPDSQFSIQNTFFEQRINNHVIVYDETGNENAHIVAERIAEEGKCLSCHYLEGGIEEFVKLYPLLCSFSEEPFNHQVDHLSLGTLGGIPGNKPIEYIRKYQKELVDKVWFGLEGDAPTQILDFLYLSSYFGCTREQLLKHNIKRVVRLGWGFQSDARSSDEIMFHDFPVPDTPQTPIIDLFEETTRIIEECRKQNINVLVHCHAGVSRSSTIVLAYLMKYKEMSLYDAWNHTYKLRPIIRPNVGFSKALQSIEKETSLSLFWMSESYFYYIDYLEFMYRFAAFYK
ncbi:Dual specificity protein phosphatase 10 [Boothiomyces sp. JEL0866]|nr:Dual specificity protein phosphatase 10 [Boothiomyces sp. JEL0866]